MTWNRRKRFAMVLFALVNLLFMQLAVAAYACPGGLFQPGGDQAAAMTQQAGVSCAESLALTMDDEQPSLCAAHCKTDQQTADKYELPVFASLAVTARALPPPRLTSASSDPPVQTSLLARTTVKSVAVRHCCFRL